MQTNQSLKRAVLENASANLVRLAALGAIALLLPPFLVRMMPKDTYSAWALVLQITAYLGLLDFGLQTAVARFVAHAEELKDPEQRNGLVSTAFVLLGLASVLGFFVIAGLAWQLPRFFKAMPSALHGQAQAALLIAGASFVLGLPFSVISAVFIGQQRNRIPVTIQILNKSVMAGLILIVVFRHSGLASMALVVALANVLSYGGSYIAWRLWASDVYIDVRLASRDHIRELVTYSAALGVWHFAMMMISGLDLTIVGIFDYGSVAYYAIAVTLTNFVTQTQNAVFAALMPASAILNARGDQEKLGEVLVSSTRYGMFILLTMALPLVIVGKGILTRWVGYEYAVHSVVVMQILVIANLIRLSFLPYATLLLGMGEHRKVIISPLAEGVVNLLASIIGARLFGAIGVAFGTLIGSFVGIGVHFLYHMPRTENIVINRRRLVKDGIFRPLFCAVPFGGVLIARIIDPKLSLGSTVLVSSLAIICAGSLLWLFGLFQGERRRLARVFA